jgi:hypothetical protein
MYSRRNCQLAIHQKSAISRLLANIFGSRVLSVRKLICCLNIVIFKLILSNTNVLAPSPLWLQSIDHENLGWRSQRVVAKWPWPSSI